MKELCGARKATLFVTILPRRDQVAGQNRGRAYNDRARAIAEANGIEAFDLLPDLSAAHRITGDALFIPWDGHNSAAANQVIAAGLARKLESLRVRLVLRR